MLNILDVEDDEERDDGSSGGPETEVSSPDAGEVLNLKGSLYGSRSDEGS